MNGLAEQRACEDGVPTFGSQIWFLVTQGSGTLSRMEAGSLSQLRRGALEYCVLALLQDEPRYAFDLVTQLGRHPALVTSEGTIYPLLSRLRKEGLVLSEHRSSEQGPPRRYYQLTRAGERALAQFVAEWREFRDAVDATLRKDPS